MTAWGRQPTAPAEAPEVVPARPPPLGWPPGCEDHKVLSVSLRPGRRVTLLFQTPLPSLTLAKKTESRLCPIRQKKETPEEPRNGWQKCVMVWEECEFRQRKQRSGNKFPEHLDEYMGGISLLWTLKHIVPHQQGFPTGSSVFPEAQLRLLPCELPGANRLISLKHLWVKLSH